MILFLQDTQKQVIALQCKSRPSATQIEALTRLLGGACEIPAADPVLRLYFIGPRREMITPWSTSAVEIVQNMNIEGIVRMEIFRRVSGPDAPFDPMLQQIYRGLDEKLFYTDRKPEPVRHIDDIDAYNQSEGLALSKEEIAYLRSLEQKIGRKLTDSEIFGFAQVNSEHCRHKIFNGRFFIDGVEQKSSLFELIKLTSKKHPGGIVSAYKDNCAFIEGPRNLFFFAPQAADTASYFGLRSYDAVLSLKAETHNFPTTVEPFNGAATGSGGEIRDRMAGGKTSYPLAGTAVYMTARPRYGQAGEAGEAEGAGEAGDAFLGPARNWLYQSPEDILIKASDGASDFGNKFGQPLICGSLLCFEHTENGICTAYDKVIMLAGGIGYAKEKDAQKALPSRGDKIVLLGGDNYRIGMGGGAVSSVATGEYRSRIELNAVQRSNPEMQKRVYNTLRAMADSENNPIISVHDHGAGGHLNCLAELVEETGGKADIARLPSGDPTLSAKEIIGNESQERMGMVIAPEDLPLLQATAERERAPFYLIGEITGDRRFCFYNSETGEKAIDLSLADMLGKTPKTVLSDRTFCRRFSDKTFTQPITDKGTGTPSIDPALMDGYLQKVLALESVACKDWLTNKVDRSVSGLIARQQCVGALQLPLSDYGMTALSYVPPSKGEPWNGMAVAIGHAPVAGLIDPAAGSVLSIAEALTNLVFAPLQKGLESVSLSANWMWPCHNEGENARLYRAVEAASDFAVALKINIPTGKDSLSMTQKYPDGQQVQAPGTLIVSAMAPVSDIRKGVGPALIPDRESLMVYIDFSQRPFTLGASAFAQAHGYIGSTCPGVDDPAYFARCFHAVQQLINENKILAGHDVSAGGLITCLLEMVFPNPSGGLRIRADVMASLAQGDMLRACFAENPGVVVQIDKKDKSDVLRFLERQGISHATVACPTDSPRVVFEWGDGPCGAPESGGLDIARLRRYWYRTSYRMDRAQCAMDKARERFMNFDKIPLKFQFPADFDGKLPLTEGHRPKAAIIREKGSNGDREMAWMLYLAGFDVKDVHTTDLSSGRETLEEIQLIVFVGGFSNADVLGPAAGWAGAFLYNPKAKASIEAFYARKDTLSLGICNGCQLMVRLGLLTQGDTESAPRMLRNDSRKFESAFTGLYIEESPSVMLKGLQGSRLGIWLAHGDGKFSFPKAPAKYRIAARYAYDCYPANPNGSARGAAAICSEDGRHLAMMPHPERCIYPWNWPCYAEGREQDEVSPWIDMFIEARRWLMNQNPIAQ